MLHSHLLIKISDFFVKTNFPKNTLLRCHGRTDYTHHSILAPAFSPRPDFFHSVPFHSGEGQIHFRLGHWSALSSKSSFACGWNIEHRSSSVLQRVSCEPCDGWDITHEIQPQFWKQCWYMSRREGAGWKFSSLWTAAVQLSPHNCHHPGLWLWNSACTYIQVM